MCVFVCVRACVRVYACVCVFASVSGCAQQNLRSPYTHTDSSVSNVLSTTFSVDNTNVVIMCMFPTNSW